MGRRDAFAQGDASAPYLPRICRQPAGPKLGGFSGSDQPEEDHRSLQAVLCVGQAKPFQEFAALTPAWLESLRPPRNKDAQDEHEYVTLEEVLKLHSVPHTDGDLALLRDQAAAALLFLSGARASAFTTLPISAVDLPGRTLRQWPELGVATKNSKRATTFLLPIPELISMV